MENIELPNEFTEKGIYPITTYNDEKGIFIKCIQGRRKRVYIRKIENKYSKVTELKLLQYLDEKYGMPKDWRGVEL